MTDRMAGHGDDKAAKAGAAAKSAADRATGGAKGPDELRRQIEHTRKRLGDTVEELAAKTDVKGRARARAADLRDKAGAMTVQLRSTAAQASHAVQERASHAGHAVQERASHAGHTVQERASHAGHAVQERASHAGHAMQDRASRAGHTVEHEAPYPVRTVAGFGRRHPGPTAALAVAAVIAAVAYRRQRRTR